MMGRGLGLLRRPRTNAPARTPKNAYAVDYAEVAQVAYELYEQRGRVPGNDLEDWLKAEAIVKQRSRQ